TSPTTGARTCGPPAPLTATASTISSGHGQEQDQQARSQHSQGRHHGGVRQYEEGRRRQ
ncbi:Hypothetical protein FKW44_014958, partial [Caligus rogercresseyi]